MTTPRPGQRYVLSTDNPFDDTLVEVTAVKGEYVQYGFVLEGELGLYRSSDTVAGFLARYKRTYAYDKPSDDPRDPVAGSGGSASGV